MMDDMIPVVFIVLGGAGIVFVVVMLVIPVFVNWLEDRRVRKQAKSEKSRVAVQPAGLTAEVRSLPGITGIPVNQRDVLAKAREIDETGREVAKTVLEHNSKIRDLESRVQVLEAEVFPQISGYVSCDPRSQKSGKSEPDASTGPQSMPRSDVDRYNLDPKAFKDNCPGARYFGASNAEALTRFADTDPEFDFIDSGDYLFVADSRRPESGYAYPRAKKSLSAAQFKSGGMNRVFSSNYEDGWRYRSVRVIKAARFQLIADRLRLVEPGQLELAEPQSE